MLNKLNALLNFLVGDGRRAAGLLALTSAALLVTVYFFQYVLYILPCELCYWQRKPHMVVIAVFVLAWAVAALWKKPVAWSKVLAFMALTLLVDAGLAGFHVGVEYHWWNGLPTCSTAVTATTLEEAQRLIFQSTVIPCDKPGWVFLGISMAAWNGLMCLGMAAFATLAALRTRKK